MKIKYIFTEVNRTVAVKCCMSWYLQELNKNGNIMVGQNINRKGCIWSTRGYRH